jgi:hypothetical protein
MRLWSYLLILLLGLGISVEHKVFPMEADEESECNYEEHFDIHKRIKLINKLKRALNQEDTSKADKVLRDILNQPSDIFGEFQYSKLLRMLLDHYRIHECPPSSRICNALLSFFASPIPIVLTNKRSIYSQHRWFLIMEFLFWTYHWYTSKLFLSLPSNESLHLRKELSLLIQKVVSAMKEKKYEAVETNRSYLFKSLLSMQELLPSWVPVESIYSPFYKPSHKLLKQAVKLPQLIKQEEEEKHPMLVHEFKDWIAIILANAGFGVFTVLLEIILDENVLNEREQKQASTDGI